MTPELAQTRAAVGPETVTFMASYLRNTRGSLDDQPYIDLRRLLADVLEAEPVPGDTGPDARLVEYFQRHGQPAKLRYWMPLAQPLPGVPELEPAAQVGAALAAEIDAALLASWLGVA